MRKSLLLDCASLDFFHFGRVARRASPLSQISPSLTSPTASRAPYRAARVARSGRPTGLDVPVAADALQAARSVAGAAKPVVAHLGLHALLHSSRSSAGKRPLPRYASPRPVCFRCRASIPLVCIQKHPKPCRRCLLVGHVALVSRLCCILIFRALHALRVQDRHLTRPRRAK